jgi:hypothetical protein
MHIYTGIRKPKETELINDVILLRRVRRKSFTVIKTINHNLNIEFQNVKSLLSTSIKERELEFLSRKKVVSRALESKEIALNEITQQFQEKSLKMKQHFKNLLKDETEKNFKIYEDKLKIVDIKIQELLSAKENYDFRAVRLYIYTYICIYIYIYIYIYTYTSTGGNDCK